MLHRKSTKSLIISVSLYLHGTTSLKKNILIFFARFFLHVHKFIHSKEKFYNTNCTPRGNVSNLLLKIAIVFLYMFEVKFFVFGLYIKFCKNREIRGN